MKKPLIFYHSNLDLSSLAKFDDFLRTISKDSSIPNTEVGSDRITIYIYGKDYVVIAFPADLGFVLPEGAYDKLDVSRPTGLAYVDADPKIDPPGWCILYQILDDVEDRLLNLQLLKSKKTPPI